MFRGMRGCLWCTLYHFSLNLSPFSHTTHTLHTSSPGPPPKHPLNASPIPHKALTLSREVDECKPLQGGERHAPGGGGRARGRRHRGRGLHSSTSHLNLSRFSSMKPQQASTFELKLSRFCHSNRQPSPQKAFTQTGQWSSAAYKGFLR